MSDKPLTAHCAVVLGQGDYQRGVCPDMRVIDLPNLEALLIGCVSGKTREWPLIRAELTLLCSLVVTELNSCESENKDLIELVSHLQKLGDSYERAINKLNSQCKQERPNG